MDIARLSVNADNRGKFDRSGHFSDPRLFGVFRVDLTDNGWLTTDGDVTPLPMR